MIGQQCEFSGKQSKQRVLSVASVSVSVSVPNDTYIHNDMYIHIHRFFGHFFGTTPTPASGGVGDCVCV
jgi:hypothetical protein